MNKKSTGKQSGMINGWRVFGVTIFVVFALISLLLYVLVRWTHNYALNTDRFTTIAGELPRQPQVAAALSKFTTQKIFESVDAQQIIKEALPEQASFLAAPLTTQLQTTVTNLTTDFVKSEQFETVWLFIVGNAHAEFIKVVTSPPLSVQDEKISELGLQLGDIVKKVASQLGHEEIGQNVDKTIGNATELSIDLRASIQTIRQIVGTIDALYLLLPFLVITFALAAIYLSRSRAKTILGFGIGGALLGAIILIVLKAVKSEVVGQFEDPVYQSAIAVSWDIILAGLTQMVTIVAWLFVGMAMLALLFGPYKWAAQIRKGLYLDKIGHTRFGEVYEQSRLFVEKFFWAFCAGAAGLIVIVLLVLQQVTWVSVLQGLLALISFCLLAGIYIKKPR